MGGNAFAAYHGYAITDFTDFDPHFGTKQEMRALIDRAHARGIKVFFDITAHYTADVIGFDGDHPYRTLAEAPYRDANGRPFDITAMAGRQDFPKLSVEKSFPYVPKFHDEASAQRKKPEWLNDRTLYHNRGDALEFAGEQILFADFFGLDDLMTEHPRVVDGMRRIYTDWIDSMDIDGYRVDTVKHVNTEFWQAFAPTVKAHANARGKHDFFIFGEDLTGDPTHTSHYTTAGRMQSVLDFPFQGAASQFLAGKGASLLAQALDADDLYTDADSNAYSLNTFLSNHDTGRLAWMLQRDRPGIGAQELLDRLRLGNALLYLWRGNPVVYYGDEQGFAGTGGDADARQDMFPTKVAEHLGQTQVGTASTPARDNFDTTHPLYRQLSSLSAYTAANAVWKRGNQIMRHADADVVAYSRIDPVTGHEYLVTANSATEARTVDIAVSASDFTFRQDFPVRGTGPTSGANRTVKVTVPPLAVSVLRSDKPVPDAQSAPKPQLSLTAPAKDGRTGLLAEVPGGSRAQATFAARIAGQANWTVLGTDDAGPYRVYTDLSKLPGASSGARVELRVVVKDSTGRIGADGLFTQAPK
ncbi:alpha-amylase family glycosyl hydrolase [Allokutzneria sp. NRRL B-24872]|uniref:alpha-amylase family glycosyl hydrolase n=1 Tax=Allokutzneria sp. NRRL B-24872 TaxID=1137961 RepID=UPI00143D94F5|nr:alpha-amylase family glycosyl hydrolase [Allokutzneria sp. NRRL B-24872]